MNHIYPKIQWGLVARDFFYSGIILALIMMLVAVFFPEVPLPFSPILVYVAALVFVLPYAAQQKGDR
jgi:hypothetical protein